MKLIIRKFLAYFLFDWLYKMIIRNDLVIFNYHEISDSPSEFSKKYDLCISIETFKKQIKFIEKYYNFISPTDLLKNEFPRPAALITFDDGFKSSFKNGIEILSDLNINSLIFVNMAPIEGELFWIGLITYFCKIDKNFEAKMINKYKVKAESIFLFITKDDISQFEVLFSDPSFISKIKEYYGDFATHDDLTNSNYKGAYLGNHQYNHFNSTNISVAEFTNLYEKNNIILKKYKNYINFFSYPFGQPGLCYTNKTHDILKSLGVKKIFTAYSLRNDNKVSDIYYRVPMFEYIKNERLFKFNCLIPPLINKYFGKNI